VSEGVSEMEQGTVKVFFSAKERRYGFLRLTSGEEIFFHFGDGDIIVPGKEAPEFSGKAQIEVKGQVQGLRDPQKDDVIMFERAEGSKGPVARPWGFKSHYDRAGKIIAKRPPPTYYRVLKSSGSLGEAGTPENPKDARVLWEGTDLEAVLKKYPLPRGNQSPGSDPLLSYYSHDDGFEVRHWWEKRREDGTWELCEDPRPLSGVLRTFERINHRW
jgi:cold shock CspA family protein